MGVSGLTVSLTDLLFKSNTTSVAMGDLADWNTLSVIGERIDITESVSLQVSGALTLDISGFVLVGATFAFSQIGNVDAEIGTAGNANDLADADLLSFSLSNVNFFAGSGGAFGGTAAAPTVSPKTASRGEGLRIETSISPGSVWSIRAAESSRKRPIISRSRPGRGRPKPAPAVASASRPLAAEFRDW